MTVTMTALALVAQQPNPKLSNICSLLSLRRNTKIGALLTEEWTTKNLHLLSLQPSSQALKSPHKQTYLNINQQIALSTHVKSAYG